jgi:hypothetical protein
MNKMKDLSLQLVDIGSNTFAIEIKDGNICFNLTEMARAFGIAPKDWLRLSETKRYLGRLAVRLKCLTADLVAIKQGGQPHEQGTWANDYRIAIRFAQWIDDDLSIYIDELVWKLLTKQAIVAEPIGGVWPVIRNGVAGYPRTEILKVAGYSPHSGTVGALKRRYPEHHFTISRIACVSAEFARLRMEQGKVRQMEIDFRESLTLNE